MNSSKTPAVSRLINCRLSVPILREYVYCLTEVWVVPVPSLFRVLPRRALDCDRELGYEGVEESRDRSVHLVPCVVNPVWSIILGQESVMWGDVFPHIADPKLLFDVWKPSKTLDTMTLKEPPIRLIEQHFKAKWRHTSRARKFWQRFREIPEWIEKEVEARSISPDDCIQHLETIRTKRSTRSSVNKQTFLTPLGLNALAKYLGAERKKAAATEVPDIESNTDDHLEDAASASSTGPSQPATGDPTPTIPEKRRAPAVGNRAPKAKKAKTHA
ncbi:hypothetical protein B0H16DRAFT_1484319 [Mycena metata]|uniref:Transcription activator GCR1-like domain-containing protein n=1 Tax=Mycena metata TaxID=1033252 RepID=A0AAD7GKD9_9AGAR|nr:hypothetical protein B0H16DRAFT_1484319 [Mycena metata]